jgi:TRAP-type uncharacterized transport system substrate-binding protein
MPFVRVVVVGLLLLALTSLGAASIFAQTSGAPAGRYQEEKRLSNASTVSIISSSISSTYTQFAQDIQDVLDDTGENGLRVLPVLGRGGGQNLRDLLFLKGIDMGTTDTSYLSFYKKKDPVLYGDIENRINYICKILNSEFHVLARKEIKSYNDLRGKKVSFWKQLSITSLAAETIFSTLGIDVIPVYLDNASALAKLRTGEISAITRMSGAPHDDYKDVTPADNFHLLPLDDTVTSSANMAKLMTTYLPAELRSEHYPQLIPAGQRVPTVAGSIVLAVYNWPENTERYAKLANFVQKFFSNISKFQDPSRHPKWVDVNLAANVPGWQRFKPAQQWLDQNRKTADADSPTQDVAFESFVRNFTQKKGGQPLSRTEREALHQEFSKWWQQQKKGARQ